MAAPETPGLSELVERIRLLETGLAERDALIGELRAQLEAQAELLRRNSSNSHLPPSSDGPGAASRGERRLKKGKSERKRGGQKGHRGAHRVMFPVERVHEVVDLFPEACGGCARPLVPVPDGGARW